MHNDPTNNFQQMMHQLNQQREDRNDQNSPRFPSTQLYQQPSSFPQQYQQSQYQSQQPSLPSAVSSSIPVSSKIEKEMMEVRVNSLEKEITNLQFILSQEKHQNQLLSLALQQLQQQSTKEIENKEGNENLDLNNMNELQRDVSPMKGEGNSASSPSLTNLPSVIHSLDTLLRDLNKEIIFPVPLTGIYIHSYLYVSLV
jgi:hypothetical protein